MRILYLFNGYRGATDAEIRAGKNHDGHFHGMYRLRGMGYETDFDEIEKHVSRKMAVRLRNIFGTYLIQVLSFWRIFSFDIVFSPTAFGSLFLKSALCIKKPRWVVLDFGLLGMIGDATTMKQKLLKWSVKKADGIVTLSPGENEAMTRMFPDKADHIKFIFHGIDTDYFRPMPEIAEEDIVFSPGRDAGRDFKTLFNATRDLPAKVIITARANFVEHLKPLPANMTHTSYDPLDLVKAYARAKVLVISLSLAKRNNDAMGLSTLVEMMAMGKPIVATDTETMRAYITHGVNGLLVKEGDAEALKKAIQSLMNDTALRKRLGDAARKLAVEQGAGPVWAANIAGYFSELSR